MEPIRNKNLFYRTLLSLMGISVCFSMAVNAGGKDPAEKEATRTHAMPSQQHPGVLDLEELTRQIDREDSSKAALLKFANVRSDLGESEDRLVIRKIYLKFFELGIDPRKNTVLEGLLQSEDTPQTQALVAILAPGYQAYVVDVAVRILPDQIKAQCYGKAFSNLVIISTMVEEAIFERLKRNFQESLYKIFNHKGVNPAPNFFAESVEDFKYYPQEGIAKTIAKGLVDDYSLFFHETQRQVDDLIGRIQKVSFGQAELDMIQTLKSRASKKQLEAIRQALFKHLQQSGTANYFETLKARLIPYAEKKDQASAEELLMELNEDFMEYMRQHLRAGLI